MGQYGVSGMTCGTIRGDDQPLAKETFTVNALGKVLENMVLVDSTLLHHRGALAVTLPAEKWDLKRRNSRPGIRGREDIVSTVAILTQRSKRIAFGDGFSMKRLRVQFLLLRVTRPAVNSGEVFTVRELLPLQILVARNAGK
jgi:hypothetical protein